MTDLLRARTRRTEVVFLLGLEEGSFPRRQQGTPFLDEEERRSIDEASKRARLAKPDQVSRERYFFYTACTRPSRRLYLVREASTDDGSPREPSPFWDEAQALFDPDDVVRWTTRRRLAQLTWDVDSAPTERERLRALSSLAAENADEAVALAHANGWDRRLARALDAFSRPTRLTDQALVDSLRAKTSFSVTELELFADCSSIWFLERLIDPRSIDGEVDARLRGSIAHQTLFKFFSGLRRSSARSASTRIVSTTPSPSSAPASRRRSTAASGSSSATSSGASSRRASGATSRTSSARRPSRRSRSSRGGSRSRSAPTGSAPELQSGLQVDGFSLTGKIDRIDVDPFSARGIVQDYKSGKTAHSAAKIESELRLQIPLYMLVLRDLVGIEPLGGLYRALAGERHARGLLRAEAEEDVPGFSKRDYLDEDEFWAQTERAKEHADPLRRADPLGRHPARPEGRLPVPDLVRPVVDVPGGEVVTVVEETRAPERRAAGRDRRAGPRLRLGGCGDGQDDGARRALRARGLRARAADRLGARDHVHGASGRRAARAGFAGGSGSSTATTSRGSSTAPGSRRSTASATAC